MRAAWLRVAIPALLLCAPAACDDDVIHPVRERSRATIDHLSTWINAHPDGNVSKMRVADDGRTYVVANITKGEWGVVIPRAMMLSETIPA